MVKLSVLILSLQERNSSSLLKNLQLQAQGKDVQILWLGDNFSMTVGEKRNKLLSIADGEYCCFIDDDDRVDENYVSEILEHLKSSPDVVTFLSYETKNGKPERVWRFSENVGRHIQEPVLKINGVKVLNCPPNHLCVWKKSILAENPFPKKNKSEDHVFAQSMALKGLKKIHIDKILYFYQYNTNVTRTQTR